MVAGVPTQVATAVADQVGPIQQRAHLTGEIDAATGMGNDEMHRDIQASSRVELLETGVINGDVKAAVLTVAAGSRMRGNADFGWPESAK